MTNSQLILSLFRFFWGFLFFAAFCFKFNSFAENNSPMIQAATLALDLIGIVVCFFAPTSFAWLFLSFVILVFTCLHLFMPGESCRCFGPYEVDSRLLLWVELGSIPVCLLGIKAEQTAELRRKMVPFGLILLFAFSGMNLGLWYSLHAHALSHELDLSVGAKLTSTNVSIPEGSNATIVVFHPECDRCVQEITSFIQNETPDCHVVFLDVSGSNKQTVVSDFASWLAVDGYPIGIYHLPTMVAVRKGIVIEKKQL